MNQTATPPIVGIGASAGGVQALQTFFETVSPTSGAAFVVVVHLAPEAHSELAHILRSRTGMTVIQVEGQVPLQGDHVYVIPPNRQLRITDRVLMALPFDEPHDHRAPIDLFFRSLAEQHDDGYAVILTGAGADGSIGVKAVKETGGIVLVQSPNEAEFASMPRNAIATEVADFVLPVRDLAERLTELLSHRGIPSVQELGDDEDTLRRILSHVRVRTGHDFLHYKRATVLRRIARRALVTRQESMVAYYQFLRANPEEGQALFNDFLISVTTFFRDPQAFASLAKTVIPHLFDGKESGGAIRVWAPGCATGEEPYTIAMLLLEEAHRRDIRPEIQLFGTDLDSTALAIAREGLFPPTIAVDLSDERLHRFFLRQGENYQVRPELRDIVLFASHNLLRDPPFSKLDLISCRNLLIYLDRNLQQQVCSTFHYSLNPGGHLLLGLSESADQPAGLFRQIDRDARLYRSVPPNGDRRPPLPMLVGPSQTIDRYAVWSRAPTFTAAAGDAALHRQMLERVAPPSILVDASHRAQHLSDKAGRYLQLSGGPVTTDAVDMVRQELRFDLRSALHRAFERGEATLSLPILVDFEGVPHPVHLQVKPVAQEGDAAHYALVLFIEGDAVEQPIGSEREDAQGPERDTVRQLQDELQLAQNRLRATREEAEATTEELRAANEELQSINEEYRSTSEELETSKEELQSINEELQTVNTELKLKLETVSRAHGDLQNLMAATDVGTLFLDSSLRIKRFTPRLTDLFNITAGDEGRPITDFTHQLSYNGLAKHARAVLRDLVNTEQEVQSRDGGWYLVRIRPYRTLEDKIDGVVATFVDITTHRLAEEALRLSQTRLQLLLDELSHRVKNTLAVAQSLARQTLRTTVTREDFVEDFEGRLASLSYAHQSLVESEWTGAELGGLVRSQLAPYAGKDQRKLRILGEQVTLPAELATPFSLVLHELATNAAKYGAFSSEAGQVEVRWSLTDNGGRNRLAFVWRESGGPDVKPPLHWGYGGLLIEKGLPGATVTREFHPKGIACALEIDLPETGNVTKD